MKMTKIILTLLFIANFGFAQEREAENGKIINLNGNLVNINPNASQNQKLFTYEHYKQSPLLYVLLNVLLPFGIGSYVQGDITAGIWQTTLSLLVITWPVSFIIGILAPIDYAKAYNNRLLKELGVKFNLAYLREEREYALSLMLNLT